MSITERHRKRSRFAGGLAVVLGALFLGAAVAGIVQAEDAGPQLWRGAGGSLLGGAALLGLGVRLLRR